MTFHLVLTQALQSVSSLHDEDFPPLPLVTALVPHSYSAFPSCVAHSPLGIEGAVVVGAAVVVGVVLATKAAIAHRTTALQVQHRDNFMSNIQSPYKPMTL